MKYNIVPNGTVMDTVEAENANEALVTFATVMDLDMGTYFKAVPADNTKVFVYKVYCDEYAYGEEQIEVYRNREDAIAKLKSDVEKEYGMKFEEIPSSIGLSEDDTFEEDYVSIQNGDGGAFFWIVEETALS